MGVRLEPEGKNSMFPINLLPKHSLVVGQDLGGTWEGGLVVM